MVNGILNILKPPGMTSHDVISFVRKTYGLKKVGHAGTLDPAAAGVLPVFLGQATRLLEYAVAADKSYRVELTLGYETDTGDATGQIVRAQDCLMPSVEKLTTVLQSFVGETEQLPPMYSAIKIAGKKLYELARAGQQVELQPRRITIDAIELLHLSARQVLFDVTCSKGTYIRSLCVDIGKKLDCPAVMSFLVRTRVGSFSLSDTRTLEELAVDRDAALLPPDYALGHLPTVMLSGEQSQAFQHGRAVVSQDGDCGLVRIYHPPHRLIGIGQRNADGAVTPVKVLEQAAD